MTGVLYFWLAAAFSSHQILLVEGYSDAHGLFLTELVVRGPGVNWRNVRAGIEREPDEVLEV